MKKSQAPFSLVLYVIAVLLVGFSIWAGVNSFSTIKQALDAGQLVMDGAGTYAVINYFVTSCGTTLFFALIFVGLGIVVTNTSKQAVPAIVEEKVEAVAEVVEETVATPAE